MRGADCSQRAAGGEAGFGNTADAYRSVRGRWYHKIIISLYRLQDANYKNQSTLGTLSMSKSNITLSRLFVTAIMASPLTASADLVTYHFSGEFLSSHALFNTGDTYSGSYTFESTAPTSPHPEPTLQIQSQAISSSLPGTGWNMTVNSSTVGNFFLNGTSGRIDIGNDTAFGDRYVVQLYPSSALPNGYALHFFEMDFFQSNQTDTALLLTSGALDTLPNIVLPGVSHGGRFFANDDIQSFHNVSYLGNSPSSVPLPATVWLLLSALAGVGTYSRRRSTQFD